MSAADTVPLLEVANLRVQVAEVSILTAGVLKIAAGDRIAFQGPSGAGKTTLLRVLSGFGPGGQSDASAVSVRGEFRWRGQPIEWSRLAGLRGAGICMLFQEAKSSLPEKVPCERLFDDVVRRVRSQRKGVALPFAEFLAKWHLSEAAQKNAGELSGGMGQRFALGLCLLWEPALLVMDEPTANLDDLSKQVVAEMLADFRGACVLSSHDHRLFDEVRCNQFWQVSSGSVEPRGVTAVTEGPDA